MNLGDITLQFYIKNKLRSDILYCSRDYHRRIQLVFCKFAVWVKNFPNSISKHANTVQLVYLSYKSRSELTLRREWTVQQNKLWYNIHKTTSLAFDIGAAVKIEIKHTVVTNSFCSSTWTTIKIDFIDKFCVKKNTKIIH